ncbi:hypothetical protein L210DRAFT_864446 [Boletus edulis BED1]|uniref:Uncharacterized protein n=1 Tax=Boletus edulis BED1 TaxID=1328754 RepID=A0AAD4C9N3_BOLED|nr:hypothetical protein L210DRAFT_864446 [Boletus edulis BED1]
MAVDGGITFASNSIQVNNASLTDPPMISVLSEGDVDYPMALAKLVDSCMLAKFNGIYYNLPLEWSPPFYFVICGLHIGVFAGWDITGPKVSKVSGAMYAGYSFLEAGERKVRQAIERGEAECMSM